MLPPTSLKPLTTIQTNIFSDGSSPVISLPLKMVMGLYVMSPNVHHAFILSSLVLGGN